MSLTTVTQAFWLQGDDIFSGIFTLKHWYELCQRNNGVPKGICAAVKEISWEPKNEFEAVILNSLSPEEEPETRFENLANFLSFIDQF